MIENINITLYIVFAVTCYLFLVLFALLNIIDSAGNYYITLKGKIRSIIVTPNTKNLLLLIKNRVYLPITVIFKFLFGYLLSLSQSFNSFDELLVNGLKFVFEESVEYSSLTFRKIYEGSIQSLILYGTAVIVVFYVILSVF